MEEYAEKNMSESLKRNENFVRNSSSLGRRNSEQNSQLAYSIEMI